MTGASLGGSLAGAWLVMQAALALFPPHWIKPHHLRKSHPKTGPDMGE